MIRASCFSLFALYFAYAAAVGPEPGQITNLVTFGDSYTDVVSLWPNLTSYHNIHRQH